MIDDSLNRAATFCRHVVPGTLGAAVCCLLLALAVTPAIAAGNDADSAVAVADPAELSEDEEDDQAGDGSDALTGDEYLVVPPELRPIGLVEEEALLGDWGDSADEDED